MLATLITVWLLYVAAMVSPGANVLLVSQLAASGQVRSARFAGVGVAAGAGIWATCAIFGVNAVFQAFPVLRNALQLAGGLYLLYLASRLWRSGGMAWTADAAIVSRAAAFRLGLLTNITNPKAALFFGSVFAASFPAQPSMALQVSAVTVVVASALAWYSMLAYLLSRSRIRAAYARTHRVTSRVASITFGALGLGLLSQALTQRWTMSR
ncbi:lysine transporter LysE [Betaproteobacteria bacterium GR16-43]|nr:lysine transporter LysE [Betaproteobacteria bacterium GR16-43]